ncbi:probable E3 ubiquitin-protein ligase RHG1A, partial [Tanacetum coccineum]
GYDAVCKQYESRPDEKVPTWVHQNIQDIASIVRRVYSQQAGGSTTREKTDDIICAICMEEYYEDAKTGTLGCEHV